MPSTFITCVQFALGCIVIVTVFLARKKERVQGQYRDGVTLLHRTWRRAWGVVPPIIVRVAMIRSMWKIILRRPVAPLPTLARYAELSWRSYRLLALMRGAGSHRHHELATRLQPRRPTRASKRVVSCSVSVRDIKTNFWWLFFAILVLITASAVTWHARRNRKR